MKTNVIFQGKVIGNTEPRVVREHNGRLLIERWYDFSGGKGAWETEWGVKTREEVLVAAGI